ncbi:hypothetical protein SK128_015198 [Halocaridina rubra]|uniref:Uncharacterized protein n=1 Tax=Halocaridina rubra TaxID=373956 RepID=A0AAN9AFA0_HALRR
MSSKRFKYVSLFLLYVTSLPYLTAAAGPHCRRSSPIYSEDDLYRDNDNDQWSAPTIGVNAAETDIASTIDGNTELTETVTSTTAAPKIVFNVSKTVNNNIESSINNANKNHNHNSNSIDEDDDDFVPPPFTVDYDLKPAFRNAELTEQPLAARGIEISGLCSIIQGRKYGRMLVDRPL